LAGNETQIRSSAVLGAIGIVSAIIGIALLPADASLLTTIAVLVGVGICVGLIGGLGLALVARQRR